MFSSNFVGHFSIQALGGQIGQFIESAISDAVNVLGHLTGQLDAAVEEVRTLRTALLRGLIQLTSTVTVFVQAACLVSSSF